MQARVPENIDHYFDNAAGGQNNKTFFPGFLMKKVATEGNTFLFFYQVPVVRKGG